MFLVPLFPYLFLNLYLSIKLRKRKYEIIHVVINRAPLKFRERAQLSVNVCPSWVFASVFMSTWYVDVMLRYGWKVSQDEINEWRQDIKSSYESDYMVYRIAMCLANIWITAAPTVFMVPLID